MPAGESDDDEYVSVGASFGVRRRAFEEGKLPRTPDSIPCLWYFPPGGLLLLYAQPHSPTKFREGGGRKEKERVGKFLALTHESLMAEYIN